MIWPATTIVLIVSPSLNTDGRKAYSTRGKLFGASVDGRCIVSRLDFASEHASMTTQPTEPPRPTRWNIYRVAGTARRHGTVEAASPTEAIQKAAELFKIIASRLIAVERR
jgi:hypothetical protein